MCYSLFFNILQKCNTNVRLKNSKDLEDDL